MPLIDRTFSSIITFTRASAATYFDSAGVLQSAANDAPRFDYDPVTLAARGMLIEEQRTNLYTYSEAFNTTPDWTPTRVNITADVATAPSGSAVADKLIEQFTGVATHNISQLSSFTSGTSYTYSIFVKAGERSAVRVLFPSAAFTSNLTANFDIAAGEWTTSPAPSAGLTVASSYVGNGWYRISATAQATATVSATILLYLLNIPSGTGAYAGNGSSGLYIWGAQLEAGAFPTSYIPTTTAAATRATDVASVNTLSPWYNQTQGTWYAEFLVPQANAVGLWRVFSGNVSNRPQFFNNAGSFVWEYSSDSPVALGAPSANVVTKFAGYYAANSSNLAVNGVLGTEDTTVTLNTPTQFTLGAANITANREINGHLRRIGYYKRRLSNAQLQAITQ